MRTEPAPFDSDLNYADPLDVILESISQGVYLLDAKGRKLGTVTSGTIGPTIDKPIAMAYVSAEHALAQHEVYAEVRASTVPMRVTPMPFVPHRYFRG